MKIRDYLQQEVFAARAAEHGCLIVYDEKRRYRDLVTALNSPQCRVIDAGASVIEGREAAMRAVRDLAHGVIHQVILWVPAKRPDSDDTRQGDPFACLGRIGTEFPAGDGDDFATLCRLAKPDHAVEVDRLFADGEPSFDTIDALDHGGSWPKLKTLLCANSPKEIFISLLSPRLAQDQALKMDPTWVAEAKEFIERNLGHKLKTRGQSRQSIADELWQLVLFSEFVFDSSADLPASLATVPCAAIASRRLIYDTCDDLRKHQDHRDLYLTKALEIEELLALPERSQPMADFGQRDTFLFEDRFFLHKCGRSLLSGNLSEARDILVSRQSSIWLNNEDRLAEWTLTERALDLVEAANNLTEVKFPTLEALIQAYVSSLRELDRRHRELEQSAADCPELDECLHEIVNLARARYLRLVEYNQAEFVRLVQAQGWPAPQLLRNALVFNRQVAPLLESGRRVAYLLIDSLRYELAVELEKQLSDKHSVRLQPVCAQLPTYTEFGMASLMPDADQWLTLLPKDGKLVTHLNGQPARDPAARLAYLQSKKGDLCSEIELDHLVQPGKRIKIGDKVKLLVVRSRDLDSIAHESPQQVLQIIPKLVRQIIKGVAKLEALGFQNAVVATDHGFILVQEQEAGNVTSKPSGNWLVQKSRCLLGQGSSDGSNLVLPREQVGIPGDFQHYAVPRQLVPYTRGELYYHEGLSLQECVLPCLTIELKSQSQKKSLPTLQISYRQGKTDKITSRRPVIDIAWSQVDAFADEQEIEASVEAVDAKGNVVGVVGSGQSLNPATQGVRIRPGQIVNVGLRMEDEFSGNFQVRAVDPNSQALMAELNLKTAYLE